MSLLNVIKHLPGKHSQQSHAGSRGGGSDPGVVSGDTLGVLYHGGKAKIQKIDPTKLQSRDSGFYGEGFYVTQAPHYAKSYGKALTKLKLSKDSTVLQVDALSPDKANPELKAAVIDSYMKRGRDAAEKRGRLDKFEANRDFMLNQLNTSPIEWKNAVRDYADAKGYDVVKYSDGEIVVRNLDIVEIQR